MATPVNCSLCRRVQETVRSRGQVMERYTLHSPGKIIAEGRAMVIAWWVR